MELLDSAVASYGPQTVLSAKDGLRTACWSFDELRSKVSAFAGYFHDTLKLKAQDRVVICCPNHPNTVAAHLGAMQAGLIVVPMDVGSSPDFLAGVVRKTDAALLLRANASPRMEGVHSIDIEAGNFFGGQPFTAHRPRPADIAQIVFTSGTTGAPKGTVLSHSNVVANVSSASMIVPQGMPLRLLSVLPLSHMLEQTVGLYLPVLKGGSVHYPPSLKPPVVLRELRRRRATGMVVVPRFLEIMLRSLEHMVRAQGNWRRWERSLRLADKLPIDWRRHLFRDLHAQLGGQLKFFLCGGAPLSPEIAMAWEAIGIRVIEGYGATECSPVIASNTYAHRHAGSIGTPVAGVEVKLSEQGEIWARGENVSRGYWRDREHTSAAFTEDGWFRTGDLGDINAEGVLRVTGRLADRIVLASGQKVFPADIEEQLRKQPGIADCVALALSNAKGQESIHASIRTDPGVEADNTAAEAVRNANARLGSHQQIQGYSIWTEADFPRTNLGKVKRPEVRAALMAQLPLRTSKTEVRHRVEQKTIRGQLAEAVRQVCKNPDLQIGDDSSLAQDLGLDSLGRVELAAAIEEQIGIAVDDEELGGVSTMKQLITVVESGSRVTQGVARANWPTRNWAIAARRLLQSLILFPAHGLFARPFAVEGVERIAAIPTPALFVANHASHMDTVSILRAMPEALRRKTATAAAADYFYRFKITGVLASLVLHTFPFSRSGNIRTSLELCGELMDDGWSILIFPEGTRSADGTLLPFKGGIGLLAEGLHVPVVPVAVEGGAAILPKGSFWPARGPAKVRFGEPVILGAGDEAQAVTRLLEDAVARLMHAQRREPE